LLNDKEYWKNNVNYPEKNLITGKGTLEEMKTILKFGFPLKGYLSTFDREEEQKDKIYKFLESIETIAENYKKKDLTIEVKGKLLEDLEVSELLSKDFINMTYSTVFVLIIMTFTLRSFFLAFMSITLMVLIAGLENCVTRGILQVSYSNFEIEALSYMVTIAVVSNQVYLMADAWRQSLSFETYKRDLSGIKKDNIS
jgi:hypothetical protein